MHYCINFFFILCVKDSYGMIYVIQCKNIVVVGIGGVTRGTNIIFGSQPYSDGTI